MPKLLNLPPARILLTLREWFNYKISHCVLCTLSYKGHDFTQTLQNDTYVRDVGINISILPWPSTKESTYWPPLICPRGVMGAIIHSTLLSCYVSLPSKFARTYFVDKVCKTERPLTEAILAQIFFFFK